MKYLLCTILVIFLSLFKAASQNVVPAKDAAKHMGKTVTITEKVFSSKMETPSGMILLNMGGYEPKQDVIIIIPAAAKGEFKGKPENDYKGKDITVTGKLKNYKGKPAIEVTEPRQVKIILVDNMKGVPIKQH